MILFCDSSTRSLFTHTIHRPLLIFNRPILTLIRPLLKLNRPLLALIGLF